MNENVATQVALKITKLQAGYGKHIVLNDIDLCIQRGEWCTLLGPNGVGKSTLLHSIIGLIAPTRGAIEIGGHSISTALTSALRCVGFASAPEKLPGLLTGRQCLEVYAAAKELAVITPGVFDLATALRFTPYLDRYVDTYSLGTRQKLSVLLALLGNPSLLVLDEAFNGLDPNSALVLKRYLRAEIDAQRCSVLLATHSLDIVERFSDSAILLLDGRITRMWDRDALNALRADNASSLENELAEATAVAYR